MSNLFESFEVMQISKLKALHARLREITELNLLTSKQVKVLTQITQKSMSKHQYTNTLSHLLKHLLLFL